MTIASHDRCAKCGFVLSHRRQIIGGLTYHHDCYPDTGYGTAAPVIRVQPIEITIRDYFASAALTGLLADRFRQFPEAEGANATDYNEAAAKYAYRFADAMLKAREAKP